jgi:hypothetical protein
VPPFGNPTLHVALEHVVVVNGDPALVNLDPLRSLPGEHLVKAMKDFLVRPGPAVPIAAIDDGAEVDARMSRVGTLEGSDRAVGLVHDVQTRGRRNLQLEGLAGFDFVAFAGVFRSVA